MNTVIITLLLFFTAAFASMSSIYELPENSVMVTMRKSELMEIQRCVAEDKDRNLCRWYSSCFSLGAPGILQPVAVCRKAVTGFERIPCELPVPLWPTPEAGSIVFECTSISMNRLETPEEAALHIRYEECLRELYATACKHRHRNRRFFWN